MLIQQIIDNWNTSAKGYAAEIVELIDAGYPAWTVKIHDGYGVAIPLAPGVEISESFSGAKLYNDVMTLEGEEKWNVLLLITEAEEIKQPFAALCAELITPGEDGILRKEIEGNPVSWWMQWKELLGNKNVNDRVYDVLGELYALRYLAQKGEHPEWNGADAATYDIECEEAYYEVKSTIARNKREITLSNLFQLDPPNGKKLFLLFCQFEAAQTGVCINSLVDDLVELGYSRYMLDHKLAGLGLEKRKSARKRNYIIHAMHQFTVDEKFPAIRENSFVGGCKPAGVKSITYVVSLDGITGENILEEQ